MATGTSGMKGGVMHGVAPPGDTGLTPLIGLGVPYP